MKTLKIKSLLVMLDDCDFEKIKARNYYPSKGYLGRETNEGGKRKHIPLEWDVVGPPPPGFIWDHKDRNPLNAQRSNLRLATPLQNSFNRRCYSKHGRKGVYKHKSGRNPWVGQITVGGKKIHLGCFATMDEAANAYAQAAKQHHGEFASV